VKEKLYTEDHEWIEMSADGKTCMSIAFPACPHARLSRSHPPVRVHADTPPGTLGISEYAAKALGDVVYIELPATDMEVSEGDAIGAVESVKSASDILTPISGTVAEINSALEGKPADINKDPEGDAWIAKITVSGQPSGKTMTKEEYTAFTEDA
jgi:glycine cleavage system H protein